MTSTIPEMSAGDAYNRLVEISLNFREQEKDIKNRSITEIFDRSMQIEAEPVPKPGLKKIDQPAGINKKITKNINSNLNEINMLLEKVVNSKEEFTIDSKLSDRLTTLFKGDANGAIDHLKNAINKIGQQAAKKGLFTIASRRKAIMDVVSKTLLNFNNVQFKECNKLYSKRYNELIDLIPERAKEEEIESRVKALIRLRGEVVVEKIMIEKEFGTKNANPLIDSVNKLIGDIDKTIEKFEGRTTQLKAIQHLHTKYCQPLRAYQAHQAYQDNTKEENIWVHPF